jgi:hypothetical protein
MRQVLADMPLTSSVQMVVARCLQVVHIGTYLSAGERGSED